MHSHYDVCWCLGFGVRTPTPLEFDCEGKFAMHNLEFGQWGQIYARVNAAIFTYKLEEMLEAIGA
jgi:hypothetical protein